MANGIYELIMMSKITIPTKHELLSTALLFWNNETNIFDFRMGPLTLTVLDMAKVFWLRSSGWWVDITHDCSFPAQPTTEIFEASMSITSLDYNSTTFKSYETSFANFILFVKKMYNLPSPIAN